MILPINLIWDNYIPPLICPHTFRPPWGGVFESHIRQALNMIPLIYPGSFSTYSQLVLGKISQFHMTLLKCTLLASKVRRLMYKVLYPTFLYIWQHIASRKSFKTLDVQTPFCLAKSKSSPYYQPPILDGKQKTRKSGLSPSMDSVKKHCNWLWSPNHFLPTHGRFLPLWPVIPPSEGGP